VFKSGMLGTGTKRHRGNDARPAAARTVTGAGWRDAGCKSLVLCWRGGEMLRLEAEGNAGHDHDVQRRSELGSWG
jgi:hypothetical protein